MGFFDKLTDSEKREMEKTFKHLIAGATARASAAIIMFPIDVIKARLQFQGNLITNVKRYDGPLHAFKTILKEEGFLAFFKGLPPRLLYITPSAAVSFALYEQFKKLFYQWRYNNNNNQKNHHKYKNNLQSSTVASTTVSTESLTISSDNNFDNNDDSENDNSTTIFSIIEDKIDSGKEKGEEKNSEIRAIFHPLVPLFAGAFARLMGTACRTPFDIIKYRLQVQGSLDKKLYNGTLDAFAKTIKNEGIFALWTGYSISLMRDVPFASIYFVSYEYNKIVQQQLFDYLDVSYAPSSLFAGACAGGFAATCTIPMDAVKTRLQTQATLPPEHQRYKGVINTFKLTYHEDGMRGFTKGLLPRLLYLMPSASLTFAFYEKYKKLFGV